MAQVIDASKNLVKKADGTVVTAQMGGWYDGQQYWNGTLGSPGSFNTQNNQPGQQGEAYVAPQDRAYIEEQKKKYNATNQPTQQPVTQNVPSTSPTTTNAGTGTGIGVSTTASINLPSIYKDLYDTSGLTDLESQLGVKEKQFLEAKGKISDNPFLSASMVDKRLSRLENKYNAEVAPIKNSIATKKADIETQLNLQTKQFDINSQSAKDALSYFNTLLDSGALNNASGEDIANLTKSTGLSSTAIYSAINAKKESNTETQVITSTADDGTVTASVINPKTGAVIKQTNLGKIGNAQTGSGTATERKEADQQASSQNLISDAQRGATLRDLVGHYGIPGGLDIDTIYRLYNTYSSFGKASETLDEVKQGVFYD